MLLSVLITDLQNVFNAHGDIQVIDEFHDDAFPLTVTSDGDTFLILCHQALGQPDSEIP